MSSYDFRLMSYDIDNEAYSYVGSQNMPMIRIIASSKEKLYLFEDRQIFAMNKRYEVLDTITNRESIVSRQTLTNKDGKIFLLSNNKLFCFDPSGEKKLIKVQDLSQD